MQHVLGRENTEVLEELGLTSSNTMYVRHCAASTLTLSLLEYSQQPGK